MVKYLLVLSLAACSVDGVVLVLPEPPLDAGADQDAQLDAVIALDALPPPLDAQDAAPPRADAAQPVPTCVCRIGGAGDGFYDSFPDGPLDARWLVADGASFASFRRENVSVVDGSLLLTTTPEAGAAIATRDLFGSATYQVQARVPAGVELAVWWRRDDEADGTVDITTPGQGGDSTRVGMRARGTGGTSELQLVLAAPLTDGSDHILRFDRYTTSSPSTSFWVDDVMRWSSGQNVPTNRAGRMWIAATGNGVVRITNTFVTPFGNSGDACSDGELRGPGLTAP
jgi:hypothetical protein